MSKRRGRYKGAWSHCHAVARCRARNDQGYRCGRPVRHLGGHFCHRALSGATLISRWDGR